ncbi:MAG: aldo/keto reductase [Anaerolineae bacterium]|jgi:aryl-alcohol dehydrogenase-like predicted oxidoreductase
MRARKLGSTNLLVTPMGLGLAALGRPGYINLDHADDLDEEYDVRAMEAHAHDVLDAAYEAGVRYFDAARSYGRAEQFLSTWLSARGLAPEEVTVGSKWGYTYTASWQVDAEIHEVKEHSLGVLRRQWDESQDNLGQHLDLYHIHSATLKSGVLENEAVLYELARLREEGTAIGLTVSGPRQREVIELATEVRIDGARLFDTVQATWNLLERSTGPALARASEAGMGIVIKEAVANGRLTDKNTNPAFSQEMSLLRQEAERLQTTVDALALAGVLAQPWVSIVLSGAAKVEHVQSNVKALDVAWDGRAASRLAPLAEPPETYWETRSRLQWN